MGRNWKSRKGLVVAPPPVMTVSEEGPCSWESWREKNFKNKDLIFSYTNKTLCSTTCFERFYLQNMTSHDLISNAQWRNWCLSIRSFRSTRKGLCNVL